MGGFAEELLCTALLAGQQAFEKTTRYATTIAYEADNKDVKRYGGINADDEAIFSN